MRYMCLLFLLLKMLLAVPCVDCKQETTKTCGRCHHVFYCSVDCQKKCWRVHRKSCGSLEIKASLIPHAGRGLFALRNYAQGEVLALYTGTRTVQGYFDLYHPYLFMWTADGVSKNIIADEDPQDAYHAAQFVNDGSLDNLVFLENKAASKKDVEDFAYSYMVRSSDAKTNNVFLDCHNEVCELQALRPIVSGEELLMAYGLDYWLSQTLALYERRGMLQEVRGLFRAVSISVERAIQGADKKSGFSTLKPGDVFSRYTPSDVPEATLLERVAALFIPSRDLVIRVTDAVRFRDEEATIRSLLKEIEKAPLEDFYDKKGRVKPHYLSVMVYGFMHKMHMKLGIEFQYKGQSIDVWQFLSSLEGDGYALREELEKCPAFLDAY